MSARSHFVTIKRLKEGANGAQNLGIILVKSKRTGTKYIEKRIESSHIIKGYAEREVCAMKQFTGFPYIIQYKASDLEYRKLGYGSIYMQHCELGSLDGLIRCFASKSTLLSDEGLLYKVFWDVGLAITHMYTGADHKTIRRRASGGQMVYVIDGWNGRLHRDIKPANVFISNQEIPGVDKTHFPTFVLGDLGINVSHRDVESGRAGKYTHSGCTPCFAPPESPSYNERGDIYMLGLLIHCLAAMTTTPKLETRSPLSRKYHDDRLRDLVTKCLATNPHDRPRPNEIPAMVWKGYQEWRKRHTGSKVAKLPKWALP